MTAETIRVEAPLVVEDGEVETSAQESSSDKKAAPTTGTCGENLTWSFADGVLTISGSGEMNPDYYYWVDGSLWGELKNAIEKVVIEDGVTTVCWYAFYDCSNLTSIEIPEGVTEIGGYAFDSCDSLTSIEIPEGVTEIGRFAFQNCFSLTSITLPNSLLYVDETIFYNCSLSEIILAPDHPKYSFENGILIDKNDKMLVLVLQPEKMSSITIPEGVTRIGSSAFSGCYNLTNITIPEGVTEIDEYAFSGCYNLTNITIPEGVTEIDEYAFSGCSSLTSINIPERVMSLGDGVFYGCSSLSDIVLSNNHPVFSFEQGCLIDKNEKRLLFASNTDSVTSYAIPDGVTSIGERAFSGPGCSSLAGVRIPDGVTKIGWNAFDECGSVALFFEGDAPEECETLGGGYDIIIAYYKEGTEGWERLIENYDSEYVHWVQLKSTEITGTCGENLTWSFLDGILTISGSGPMISRDYDSDSLWGDLDGAIEKVVIEDGVTEIGDCAFYGCINLTNIEIPKGVTEIGEYAFSGSGLTNIEIPEGVTSIGEGVFSGCSKLESIVLPEGLTRIGSYFFSRCERLKEITIPEGVTEIGRYAFSYCDSLNKVVIPNSLMDLSVYAFLNYDYTFLTELVEIEVADDNPTFEFTNGCLINKVEKELRLVSPGIKGKIVIPEGTESIGRHAVSKCAYVSEIVVPASVKKVSGFGLCTGSEVSIYFKGDAPEGDADGDIFYDQRTYEKYDFMSETTVYYLEGTKGWEELQAEYPKVTWVKLKNDLKTGWIKDNGTWQYYDENGVKTVGWKYIDNKWYFFDGEGIMKTGWVFTGGKWYYMTAGGAMTTGWQKVGNKWYYMASSGAMTTGWLKLGSKWYYLDNGGAMVTGNKVINGKTYSFNASGVWIK